MKNNQIIKNGIHVIILGGTIDFELNPEALLKSGTYDILIPRKNSIIPFYFSKRIKYPSEEIIFSRVTIKDSRNLTKNDLLNLVREIKKSSYKRILVTMGIAKMNEVFIYLKKEKIENKIVGLVGSQAPLSTYKSDGGFHLGFAVSCMQKAEAGIYNFHPENNRKKVTEILKECVFLMTGGTIDSGFSDQADTAIPYEHSHIPEYFKNSLGIELDEPDFVFKEICMKDSRNLTEEEIAKLIKTSVNLKNKKQIITCGTYSLPDISNRYRYLVEKNLIPKNNYLFIGAMLPEDVYYTDVWFNIGYAVGKINQIENKIGVSMHGITTTPENILKQLHEAKFKMFDNDIRI